MDVRAPVPQELRVAPARSARGLIAPGTQGLAPAGTQPMGCGVSDCERTDGFSCW